MWYPWVLWQTEAHFTCKSFVRVTSLSWYSGTFCFSTGSPALWEPPQCWANWDSWPPYLLGSSLCQLSKPSFHFSVLLKPWGTPPPIQLLRADSRDLNSDNWAEVSPIQGAGSMASLSPTCSTTIKTALLSACNGAADRDLEAAPACLQPRPLIRCCVFASPLL